MLAVTDDLLMVGTELYWQFYEFDFQAVIYRAFEMPNFLTPGQTMVGLR